MSRTRGLSNAHRAANYLDLRHEGMTTTRKLTGKQKRRLRHKAGHLDKRWSGRAKR